MRFLKICKKNLSRLVASTLAIAMLLPSSLAGMAVQAEEQESESEKIRKVTIIDTGPGKTVFMDAEEETITSMSFHAGEMVTLRLAPDKDCLWDGSYVYDPDGEEFLTADQEGYMGQELYYFVMPDFDVTVENLYCEDFTDGIVGSIEMESTEYPDDPYMLGYEWQHIDTLSPTGKDIATVDRGTNLTYGDGSNQTSTADYKVKVKGSGQDSWYHGFCTEPKRGNPDNGEKKDVRYLKRKGSTGNTHASGDWVDDCIRLALLASPKIPNANGDMVRNKAYDPDFFDPLDYMSKTHTEKYEVAVAAHLCMGYIYRESHDTKGCDPADVSKIKNMIGAVRRYNFTAKGVNLDNYRLYVAFGGNKQDIGWIEGWDPDPTIPDSPKPEEPNVEVQYSDLHIHKRSADGKIVKDNPCYSLEGAVYGIFLDEDCVVKYAEVTTDAEGNATRYVIPEGKYYIRELKPPKGYLLNDTIGQVTCIRDEDSHITMYDVPAHTDPDIRLVKKDVDRGGPNPSGDGTLGGARFRIRWYLTTEEKSFEELAAMDYHRQYIVETDNRGRWYANGTHGTMLTSEEAGEHSECNPDMKDRPFAGESIEGLVIPNDQYRHGAYDVDKDGRGFFGAGTYTIEEIKAPEGYNLPEYPDNIQKFILDTDATDSHIVFFENNRKQDEKPKRGGFTFQKRDIETEKNTPQGDATLGGGTYEVINLSTEPVVVPNNGDPQEDLYAHGEVCFTFTTNGDGYYASPTDLLPYGSYKIREVTAPTGYLKEGTLEYDFKIREEGEIINIEEKIYNQVIRGGVQVVKEDKEFHDDFAAKYPDAYDKDGTYHKSQALGGWDHGNNEHGTHLEGIEYTIWNKSQWEVLVDGTYYQPGDVITKIYTHWNEDEKAYTAEVPEDYLPYGTYDIQETKTTESYLNSQPEKRTFTIRENHKIQKYDRNNSPLIWVDQVIRGEFNLVKIAEDTSKRLSVPFLITNVTTGEQHVIVTDINGEYDSRNHWAKHTDNTNGNDHVIGKGKTEDDPVDMSTVKPLTGIWFGKGEHNDVSSVDDNLGALPYGRYDVQELYCDNNLDYEMQHFTFNIYRDGYTVHLGTVTDIEPTPVKLKTIAKAPNNLNETPKAGGIMKLKDTIQYENTEVGLEYTFKATLMKKLVDKDGNVSAEVYKDKNGKTYTAEKTFVSHADGGEIEIEMDVLTDGLQGEALIFYEEVFCIGRKVGSHEDPEDIDQTVHFPEIKTTLGDVDSKQHVSEARPKTTLVDRVHYKNLVIGKEHVMTGMLYQKSDGQPFKDKDGNVITVTKKFVPSMSEGYVDLSFTFDSSLLAGETIVAGETCTYRGKEVGVHFDLEDPDQSVRIVKIGTAARDGASGLKSMALDDEAELIDTVSYVGLLPGEEYELITIPMDKTRKHPVEDANKRPYYGTMKFAAKESDPEHPATVDASVTIDARQFTGREIVFFEYIRKPDEHGTYVYEELEKSKDIITKHTDYEDEAQTLIKPEIKTEAVADDLTKTIALEEETYLIDTVKYDGLTPGQKYVMEATLMDKGTGREIRGAKATAEFTASETGSGEVKVEIKVNGRELKNHAVFFEECYVVEGHVLVGEHKDLDDPDQTVQKPEIATKAEGADNSKVLNTEAVTQVVDRVQYKGLTPGRKYKLRATAYNHETGKQIVGWSGEHVFTAAESGHGLTEVAVAVDTTNMSEFHVVFFEELYDIETGSLIAEHKDLEDPDQTMTISKKTEEPPKDPCGPDNPDCEDKKDCDNCDEDQNIIINNNNNNNNGGSDSSEDVSSDDEEEPDDEDKDDESEEEGDEEQPAEEAEDEKPKEDAVGGGADDDGSDDADNEGGGEDDYVDDGEHEMLKGRAVPKTGLQNPAVWFVLLSLLCVGAGVYVKKFRKKK